MIDCKRCGNTGRIVEQYTDTLPLALPAYGPTLVTNSTMEIKTRERECPACLGFSAVPLRPKYP